MYAYIYTHIINIIRITHTDIYAPGFAFGALSISSLACNCIDIAQMAILVLLLLLHVNVYRISISVATSRLQTRNAE